VKKKLPSQTDVLDKQIASICVQTASVMIQLIKYFLENKSIVKLDCYILQVSDPTQVLLMTLKGAAAVFCIGLAYMAMSE
jgi:hypothetical protein